MEEWIDNSRTVIEFVVSKTGKIKNVEAREKYKGTALSDSLIKVIERMPDWIPGKQSGENVDVVYTIPLHIHLKQ